MEQKMMEVVLKYYREKYHLRQEDICRGICSVTTLSRLEQGSREVDSLLGQTLLGRIGKEVTLFETILSEQDYELWKMREQIEKSVENNQVKTAKKKIREYRGVMPQDESVHEQYCLYQEARTMIAEKNTGSSLCGILEKGICLTIPEFRKSMEKVRLYSPVEIGMILLRLLTVCFFYLVLSGIFADPEHLVKISFISQGKLLLFTYNVLLRDCKAIPQPVILFLQSSALHRSVVAPPHNGIL